VYSKIIVGYNGSSEANDALALGALMAKSTDASLLVAYVHGEQPKFEGHKRDFQAAQRTQTTTVLDSARDRIPEGVSAEVTALGSPYPAQGLQKLAKSERADLLAIGSTHHGPVGRVIVGSAGEVLLSGTSCAVTVAPRGFHEIKETALNTIGVAFDGSPESEVALRSASSLASKLGAKLRVISVSRRSLRRSGGDGGLDAQVGEAIGESAGNLQIETMVLRGDPASKIIEAANDVDILVTGSRGRGPLRQALLGSVSTKLMRSAPCCVLVVPRGASVPAAQ
jgi:nucleotide-binding universal stress UspA family protein